MKISLTILIICICFISHGQENSISSITIEWEELSAPLSIEKSESKISEYQLLEVNLSVDLRKQSLSKDYTMLLDSPKYKDISSIHTVSSSKSKSSRFTISGSGYNFNTNTGNLKNNAYKDASIYLYNNYDSTIYRRNTNNAIFIY